MRALPLIERVMLIVIAVLLALLAVALLAWHQRWRELESRIAATPPNPAIPVAPPLSPAQLALDADLHGWTWPGPLDNRSDLDDPGVLATLVAQRQTDLAELRRLLAAGLRPSPARSGDFAEAVEQASRYWHAGVLVAPPSAAATAAAEALAGDQAVIAAFTPPNGTYGFGIRAMIRARLDELQVIGACTGSISEPVRRAWQNAPDDELAALASAEEGDRRWNAAAGWEDRMDRDPLADWLQGRTYVMLCDPLTQVEQWWNTPNEYSREIADRDRDEALLAAGPLTALAQANVFHCYLRSAFEELRKHRFAVLATQVIARAAAGALPAAADRAAGALPAAGAIPVEATGLDLAGDATRPTLVYRRLDEHRFAIAIDPAGTAPADVALRASGQRPLPLTQAVRMPNPLYLGDSCIIVDLTACRADPARPSMP